MPWRAAATCGGSTIDRGRGLVAARGGPALTTKPPGSKVSLVEVARRAGVSTATAGRVLGGYGYSSDGIRDRVREAAVGLGYRPNRLARGLIRSLSSSGLL